MKDKKRPIIYVCGNRLANGVLRVSPLLKKNDALLLLQQFIVAYMRIIADAVVHNCPIENYRLRFLKKRRDTLIIRRPLRADGIEK